MSTSIVASYNDAISVSFRSDAWFNATQVGRQFGKKPDDWLRTSDTKEYIQAISQICDFQQVQLVSVKRGSPDNGGGTWMHPKLGIPFARWLDAKFGVWCDMQIEKILHGQPYGLKSLESPTITPSEQQALSEIVDIRAREYDVNVGKAKAEIWSRLHNKFRIAKYSQLPREQLADAIAYVMQMTIKTPKVDTLASMIQFSRAAGDITNKRFLVSFVSDDRYVAKQLTSDAIITTPKKMAKDIRERNIIFISNDDLLDLAFSSLKRLHERADLLSS